MKGVFPLKMARLANQIVHVCAYLSNFSSSLVPPPTTDPDNEDDEIAGDEEYDGDISETSGMDSAITLDDDIL